MVRRGEVAICHGGAFVPEATVGSEEIDRAVWLYLGGKGNGVPPACTGDIAVRLHEDVQHGLAHRKFGVAIGTLNGMSVAAAGYENEGGGKNDDLHVSTLPLNKNIGIFVERIFCFAARQMIAAVKVLRPLQAQSGQVRQQRVVRPGRRESAV